MVRCVSGHGKILGENRSNLFRADFLQLINGAHHVSGLRPEAQDVKEAVEDLAVVDTDLKAPEAQGGEGIVDDGGHLGLVGDIQRAVADHIDIGLIKLPEPAPLCPLSPVDLSDLKAPEGESKFIVVQRHILGQGDGEIKTQAEVRVPFGKAVYLLFGLSAAFSQKHLAGLDGGGIQGGKTIERVGFAQGLHHALELYLPLRQ